MKIQKNVSLDPQVIQAIQKLAEKDRRTFSGYVNRVLRHWIDQQENRPRDGAKGEG